MTNSATSAVPPTVWLPDTSSLLSMAVDPRIDQAVRAEMRRSNSQVRVVDIVSDELEYRAARPGTDTIARRAIETLDSAWRTIDTSTLSEKMIEAVQDEVCDGRLLRDQYEHWSEATIIVLGRQAADRGSGLVIYFLTEDFEARRVASGVKNMAALSIHRLLYERVKGGRMTAAEAAQFSAVLRDAGRGPDIAEADFQKRNRAGLGRVGRP